jgi:tetratricopeptide (TPR) repeat protein
MSLLGKLFGARSLDDERAHADDLFQQQQFGAAKLAYERAEALAKAAPDLRQTLAARVIVCRDAIANAHLAEAERLLAQGSVDLARDELQSVTETAADQALVRAAEERMERLERAVVRAELAHDAEQSPEDRFELIAGGFEDDQYAEYLAHGEPVKQALLQLHDGQTAEARRALDEIIATADAPRYLWFELGRARLAEGDTEGGAAALERFLASLHADEGGDARLLAHMELAQQLHARGDFDGAVAHYESALTSLPEDPRPYLAMANFFRREKLFDEAIEVIEAGIEALEGKPPDFRLWQELGLAHSDAGHDAEAKQWLERVVAHLAGHGQTDLPPEGTRRLAALYESSGAPGRALDLYSLLAAGSDRPNLHVYHLDAARLMASLGLEPDARRMLQRARELAPQDEQIQASISQALEQLAHSANAAKTTET